ncbi:hypothetical protein [Bosea sp. LjRoot237]|uniref:hypothetical protein n=1 Tax=Bosea sp. LjRoot237 TaxID=3342292 RepID=UPI003ECDB967
MSDWIEWSGGACPVAAGTSVIVRFRCGEECETGYAEDWDWIAEGRGYDIVAYRLTANDNLTKRAQFDATEPLQEEIAINISAQICNGVRPDAVQVLEWAAALYEAEVGAA